MRRFSTYCIVLCVALCANANVNADDNDREKLGALVFSGGVQHESLFPTVSVEDKRTSPRADWAKIDHLSNTYLDMALRYQYNATNAVGFTGISGAIRGELTQWPMLGYAPDFGGYGLSHMHVESAFQWGSVTIGDVYGQFGSGLILRLYEERSLGIDNALRGGKVVVNPYRGIRLEALGGKQRRYWNCYTDGAFGFNYRKDALLGANVELSVEEWNTRMQEANANLLLGGSYVSKYQAYGAEDYIYTTVEGDPNIYRLNIPEWVGAGDVRADFRMKGWNALVEYAYKANDPSVINHYSYDPGQALLASLSYSQKGMSCFVQAKHSYNMSFRSDRLRNPVYPVGTINNLPAFANQHTYALASLYAYATQPDGEWAFQGELRYTFRRGTKMGGKYGSTLKLNASHIRGSETSWRMGREYYTDVNLELNKKINKQWYIGAMLMYQSFDLFRIYGEGNRDELIRSGIGVVDVKYSTTKNVQMRAELQYLFTRQDQGQWIYALYELSLMQQLMLTASIQHCIGHGNPVGESEQGNNYYTFLATWQHDAHRLSLGYTKNRKGFCCSGGVCREIPAQEGVTLTYNFTW